MSKQANKQREFWVMMRVVRGKELGRTNLRTRLALLPASSRTHTMKEGGGGT